MIAAKTTHGRYAVSGAPKRAKQLYGRAVVARILLASAAVRLWAYLPPAMKARGPQGLLELSAPIHPSNLPFVAPPATMPNNVREGARDTRRAAGRLRGAAHGLALRGRRAERAAAAVEAAARAPWRAAITFARAAKRAAKADPTLGDASGPASVTTQDVCNNPLQREIARRAAGVLAFSPAQAAGSAGVTTRDVCNNPLQREIAFRAAGLRASPPAPSAHGAPALVEVSGPLVASPPLASPPVASSSTGALRDARNDASQREPDAAWRLTRPTPGKAAAARGALPASSAHGAPALAGVSRPPLASSSLASPPLGSSSVGASGEARNDALQREPDAARRLTRPIPGKAGVARGAPSPAPLEGTVREQLAALFGRAVPAGWQPPMAWPVARPPGGTVFD